jgi:hypothetical protein
MTSQYLPLSLAKSLLDRETVRDRALNTHNAFRLWLLPSLASVQDSLDSRLYRSTETTFLLQSPFPGLLTCVPSRRLVPPMPIGHGSLPLVEPSRALPTVFVPDVCLSRFHLPASLGSTASSLLRRLCHLSGRFFGPLVGHERRSFPE